MSSYLERRKKRKLYQQWAEQSGLPQEEVPKDIQQSESYTEEIGTENEGVTNIHDSDGFSLRLRFRHLFILGLIFAFLLIVASVLATILVMQSC